MKKNTKTNQTPPKQQNNTNTNVPYAPKEVGNIVGGIPFAPKEAVNIVGGIPFAQIIPPTTNPPVIPDDKAEQIENCLNNSLSTLNQYIPITPDSEFRRQIGITLRNQMFITDTVEFMQQFPNLRPASLNVTDMIDDLKSYNIFILLHRIAHSLERLL
jgi:hypothetical protein